MTALAAARRKTRQSVKIIDRIADSVITIGGLSVIVAVIGIVAFLISVAIPLFTGGEASLRRDARLAVPPGRAVATFMDDHKILAVVLEEGGRLRAFHVATGTEIAVPTLDFGGRRLTSFGQSSMGDGIAFGFADGSVTVGRLRFGTVVLPTDQVPAGLRDLGERALSDGRSVYVQIDSAQVRKIEVDVDFDAPQPIAEDGSPIVALGYRIAGTVERPSRVLATVDGRGVVRLSRAESRRNILTGQTTTRVETSRFPDLPAALTVADVLLTESADQIYVADTTGIVHRFDSRDFTKPVLAESIDLFPGPENLTVIDFLIGEQSIVAGGSQGSVDVYARLQRADAKTVDGYQMIRIHRLEPHAGAVRHLQPSHRGKAFLTADENGAVWFRHSTSQQVLVKLEVAPEPRDVSALALSPRDDGAVALAIDGRYRAWDMNVPHPETTWASIFGHVWYEGYSEPSYTWQSSSGTDSFEPKFSLIPLMFGTFKATLYSLLFAVPIALLGAIYTSEFVHHRVRAVVKPTMEMMASLPSVVLGFIAALVLAPWVENWIAAILLVFVVLPVSLVAAAYAWQLIPQHYALRLQNIPKFSLMFVVVIAAFWIAFALGQVFEALFFAGDLRAWLDGKVGSPVPFLVLLGLPVALAITLTIFDRVAAERFAAALKARPRFQAALLDLGRWLAILAASVVLSVVIAWMLTAIGVDARNGLVGTYVQRNTLIVGFAMGFAVVPIIYTIAEDSLNAVPPHLRAASLACGATPWQTATSVILPTAMSGVFAAIMVGMGRAVGETMIVVMAAGNTPLLDWNVFNGLRALSANIAVELPEAVKDSTLFRMLFLAALVLFVMTFAINTGSEIIRQRFRRRAAQL
ncbi:MAG: ABC transporter permease subunit [Rhodospirillales bacterium]|nr:ABC transporter permease subunit [Rhodospirillales bacterium]